MITRDLTQGWSLRPTTDGVPEHITGAGAIPAVVPGSVHTDLLAAGLIPDPYTGTHEGDLVWMHRAGWRYDLALAEPAPAPDERVDLVFEGLDTVATLSLGGRVLGRTANQHRSYRFDVRSQVAAGDSELRVAFASALEHAEAATEALGERPRAYDHPFNAIRKMACSFGWDWGPDLQTAGIWRTARVQRWRTARVAAVRTLATLAGDLRTGRLDVHVEVERSGLEQAGPLDLRLAVSLPGQPPLRANVGLPAGQDRGVLGLDVRDAPIWWPAGYGDQPMVDVVLELSGADAVLETRRWRTAFRSVALDTSADGGGERFVLVVNGREVFVKGLNWIPEDHLLTRLGRHDYVAAVDRAVAAHANLLRVWGGGIYESDDFYDVCDERGVLVWQDFALACAAYAEEEPLRGEVLAEARENVVRLSAHPSLVVWNGGNENIWGHEDWGWKESLAGATWGAGYYDVEFPALLRELDPTRVYSPGSPASPGHGAEAVHPNDDRYGTHHEWEVWNRVDYTAWLTHAPRFASEFGWQAPPTWATLTAALAPEDLAKEAPAFTAHQKAEDGNGKLDRGLAEHFGVPADFEDWHWATQLNQARATALAVEHLRALAPHTMGSIVWQLNDCWPVTSWAVVDGDGRLKPAWYALRRAYAPRLVTLHRAPDPAAPPQLVLVNDHDEAWRARVHVRRVHLDGSRLADAVVDVEVGPRETSTTVMDAALTTPGAGDEEVLVADVDGLRAVHSFVVDRLLRTRTDAVSATARRVAEGYEVLVTASSLARDVTVLADKVAPDAVVDDGLVTLLAGESATFLVETSAEVDPAAFTLARVVCSAGGVVAAAGSALVIA